MRRLKLAVDEQTAKLFEQTGQMDQGEFRGTGHEREHTLAEEGLAEAHAVETTHQLFSLPHLDTGGKTLTVQFRIGLDDVRAQPGALLLIAVLSCGTALDDTLEILVDREAEVTLLDQLLHGVADVNLFGEDDEALQRTVPQGLFPIVEREPGKETMRVS